MGTAKFISSGIFAVGGYDWSIRFYPDGYSKDETAIKDYISIFLELKSMAAKVRASCDLRLVDQTTGLSSSVHRTEQRMFNHGELSAFAPQDACFKKRSELESSLYLRNDVTVMKHPQVSETCSLSKIDVPRSNITEHLGKLLEEKEGADVDFVVEGEVFAAHKIVLAMRSPVLKAELFGSMREATAQRVIIKDMQPAVFRALLHFIYTDSLPRMDVCENEDISEMIRHLLVAADRYAIDRLKLLCQSMLCQKLCVETVATTLALADQHNCDRLKDVCLEFIAASNVMGAVVATEGYKNLKRNCPYVLVEALEKATKLCKT